MADVIAGQDDSGTARQELIYEAVFEFQETGATALCPEAAVVWRRMAGDTVTNVLSMSGARLPESFTARATCAVFSGKSYAESDEPFTLDLGAAMWKSIVTDPEFSALPKPCQAAVLNDYAVAFLNRSQKYQDPAHLDEAIPAMRRGLAFAEEARLADAFSYRRNLTHLLLERYRFLHKQADREEAIRLVRAGLDASAQGSVERFTFLAGMGRIAEVTNQASDFELAIAEFTKTLEDTAVDTRYREQVARQLAVTARDVAYSLRSAQGCERSLQAIREVLSRTNASEIAEAIEDEYAAVLGLRASLRS